MESNIIIFIIGIICLVVCIIVFTNNLKIKDKIAIDEEILNSKNTILDILKIISQKYPSSIALKIKDGKQWNSITYDEYYKKVKLFGQCINKWLGKGTNVGIIGFNSPGWFYSHLGTMMNSGKSVGIYPSSTSEICEYIVRSANLEVIVAEDETQIEKFTKIKNNPIKLIIYYSPIQKNIVSKFENIGIPVVSMGNFMTNTTKLERLPKISDTATIIYTSGTTSKPKGVSLTHQNIMGTLNNVITMIKSKSTIKYIEREQIVSYLPLSHIAAQLIDIYLPIVTLSTVWFADKDALKSTLGSTLKDAKPTIFIGMPRVWEKIQETVEDNIEQNGWKGNLTKIVAPWKIRNELGLNKCKLCISSAAPMSDNCRYYFDQIGIKIYDIYGMSETCGPISISAPGIYKPNSVGLTVMDLKLTKDNEIIVKGNNLFSKYHGDKKESKKSFTKDGWFKTGDLGKVDQHGYLYIVGRKKDIIITAGGENISPQPIENLLKEKLGKYFDYIVVIGDKRKFLSVILNRGNKNKAIDNTVINQAIEYTNSKSISNVCTIKKWLIIPNIFSVGDELTPTLKIRRLSIQEKYKNMINKLYK